MIRFPRARRVMRFVMAAFYFSAGALHLWAPDSLLPITPFWVPAPRLVILLTGLCEIAGAIALLTPRLRRWSGAMLALYATCVFPANIVHAFYAIEAAGLPTSWWYHGPRLMAQPIIIWWALFCASVVDWPLRRA